MFYTVCFVILIAVLVVNAIPALILGFAMGIDSICHGTTEFNGFLGGCLKVHLYTWATLPIISLLFGIAFGEWSTFITLFAPLLAMFIGVIVAFTYAVFSCLAEMSNRY